MNRKSWSFSVFPNDFQKETLLNIGGILKKGESIQLVGAPGAGTSTIVKLFSQAPKIKDKYFSPKSNMNFLILDAYSVLEKNSLTASRLLLSLFGPQTKIPLDNLGVNKELTKNIENICSVGNIVLVIDHIQEFNYPELKPFFTNLTFLYGKFRHRFCFLSISVKPLTKTSDLVNFGVFGRILTNNILYIPPLNRRDGIWFIKDVTKQTRITFKKNEVEKIYEASLGFPRTIKKIIEAVGRGCSLNGVLSNPRLDPALALHLGELEDSIELVGESPILSAYKKERNDASGELIGEVEFKQKLTKSEESLVKLYYSKKGEIITREEGIISLWGEGAINVSDHAYDQIIHRLRNKLKHSNPLTCIETVRGRGHVLRIEN